MTSSLETFLFSYEALILQLLIYCFLYVYLYLLTHRGYLHCYFYSCLFRLVICCRTLINRVIHGTPELFLVCWHWTRATGVTTQQQLLTICQFQTYRWIIVCTLLPQFHPHAKGATSSLSRVLKLLLLYFCYTYTNICSPSLRCL